jgi:hypothetical protein
LYCIVDDVVDDLDAVVVLGMETHLAEDRLLRCIEVVEGVRLTGGRLFRCEFEDVAVRIVGIQYVD